MINIGSLPFYATLLLIALTSVASAYILLKPTTAPTSALYSMLGLDNSYGAKVDSRKYYLLDFLFQHVTWARLRILYYINNWVYTTNHKRIAVNYFWFVIFSGICGMVLATIIRLEMAYPGVGILAGDSLQYLSVVTAHAVIMVFFMIMPLLFGAFGNFLLPTQLGVHDVAFPRLNSAAFWFLPAGLLMLVQLVCLDRRYQRMNCYNIREIQTILKSKYSPNVSDVSDVHFNLNDTVLGLRYQLGGLSPIDPSMSTFYQNSLFKTPSYKVAHSFLNTPIVDLLSSNLSTKFVAERAPMFLVMELDMPLARAVISAHYYLIESVAALAEAASSISYTLSQVARELRSGSASVTIFTNWAELSSFHGKLYTPKFDSLTALSLQMLIAKLLNSVTDKVALVLNRDVAQTATEFTLTVKASIEYFTSSASVGAQALSNSLRETFFYERALIMSSLGTVLSEFKMGAKEMLSGDFLTHYLGLVRTSMSNLSPSEWLIGNALSSRSFEWMLLNFNNLTPFTRDYIQSTQLANLASKLVLGTYSSSNVNLMGSLEHPSSAAQEQLSNQRFLRNMNSVFKYDFKVGNYLPDNAKKMNPHLLMTIKDLTTGVRKSSWFNSAEYSSLLQGNVANHLLYFSNYYQNVTNAPKLIAIASKLDTNFDRNLDHSVNPNPTNSFYNFMHVISSSSEALNLRWVSVNAMDQKFYKMFATASMQQRIYANWRQLKFTREAWRCKLLAARHQNTLYKRYISEDSVVWAVERNAKDVLPGWAMITPFSARTRFTAIGKVDIGLMGVFLVLNSSIVSSANFLVTYRYLSTLNNRKMRDARSFFTEGVMVASWMMIAANPMLAIGILMLLSDRHWQTSFFDYSGGGDTVLFQHMFWFFGHPEVYVIMIPAFGFNNTILSFYLRKRVSARASLLYSMYTIAFLGFFVWGHHMYMVGLAHTTRMLFSTLTVMISVPAATKLMHWCVTLVNSSFVIELPMVFQLLFIFFFVSGGISGMAVAHTGMDILFHDSFYVVGHFHVMLAGSAMFASFGAFYFYFPAIFGVKYSRIYGYIHCLYYLIGQLMTVVPMFWLGYAAMPRRVLDYPAALGGWHAVVSAGHLLSVAGMTAFFIMIFDSIRHSKPATRNSFGVSRFNTRLNFYIYEGARTWFLQRKGWYLSRFNRHNSVRLNELNFSNNEYLETTLYTYVIIKK